MTWLHWPSAARITAELVAAGARVDVLCSDFHPIRSVAGLGRLHRYDILSSARPLARAIARSAPDHLVITDDIALGHVQALRAVGGEVGRLIESSLGPAEAYDVIASRTRFAALARSAGLNVPESASVTSLAELEDWLARYGAPAFLKTDGTCAGDGVRLIRNASEAGEVFAELGRVPSFTDAFDEAARLRVFSKSQAWIHRRPPLVSIHGAISGEPANCSAFAWRGEVQDVVSVVTLKTLRPFGAATVVQAVESAAMRQAAVSVARLLGLTGFFGLDFIIDAEGRAWVLELNPRPTQISHLALGPRRDLVMALISKVAGDEQAERPLTLLTDAPIALFPHMINRTDRDPLEQDDVPFGQPRLVEAFSSRHRSVAAIRDLAARVRPKRRPPLERPHQGDRRLRDGDAKTLG